MFSSLRKLFLFGLVFYVLVILLFFEDFFAGGLVCFLFFEEFNLVGISCDDSRFSSYSDSIMFAEAEEPICFLLLL